MTAEAPHAVSDDPRTGPTPTSSYGNALSADAFLSLGCMEGLYEPIVEPDAPAIAEVAQKDALWPGYAFAVAVTAVAYGIHFLPIGPLAAASTAILAIIIGLIIRNTLSLPDSVKVGCKHIVKKGIPIAIVLMGAGLNLAHLASVGVSALLVTVLCVGIALAAGYYFGRLFGLGPKTSLLLGVGTGICGNSAIVAVAPLIDADDDDLVLSVGAVNLFGLLAMLTWPLVGRWLALGDQSFGIWSGTSIHAVPQVVAAGFAYSTDAGTLATVVKLVRVALLAPMLFILAMLHAKHHLADSTSKRKLTVHYARFVPWFVWGFLVMALLNTLGFIPTLQFPMAEFLSGSTEHVSVSVAGVLKQGGKTLLTLALAAIGLEVNLRQLAGVGAKAMLAGLVATVTLGVASLILIGLLL